MRTRQLEDIPGWSDCESSIGSSLRRMCEIMAPEGDEARLAELQTMADRLLAERPAYTAAGLEHRLGCLCDAVERLGPWAEPKAIVDLAVDLSTRLN